MNWRCVRMVLTPLLFILATQAQAAIPATERDALLALYTATGGDLWHNHSNWNTATGTECSWYGVSCDAELTTVTGLILSANHLKGRLPTALNNLTGLTNSDLRYNAVFSDNQSLINFLDTSGPLGSLQDTQTLDADGIVFSNVTNNSFDVRWNPVAYMQAGGYRVYRAEQIDSETGSVMTDFVQVAEVTDKSITTTSQTDLVTCRQYFFKVVSYTAAHSETDSEVQSDGIRGPVTGTIPGFNADCKLIGSPYHDVFNLTSAGVSVNNITVVIAVAKNGSRTYEIIYPGEDISVGTIDGASGSDDINIVATNSITIAGDVAGGSILINGANISLSGGTSAYDYPVIISAGSFITTGEITAIDSIDASEGSSLIYGEGPLPLTSGLGIFDLTEDAVANTLVTAVNVQFLGHDEVADPVVYQISAGNDDGVFSIDSNSGEMTLVKPLDFEAVAQYVLDITASDSSASYVGTVTVNITDVVEAEATVPAGCSLHRGAAFDPIWLFMLLFVGVYRYSRSNRRR